MADYKDFKYRGKWLSGKDKEDGALDNYNGFLVNGGEDLKFFNASNFNHEFVTPQFGNKSYFLGTTRENREFNFNIALSAVTLAQYRNFLAWLNPREEGELVFDYDENYSYDVKVNSISEATFYVVHPTVSERYNIEIQVGFITKNDWAAKFIGTNDLDFIINTTEDTYTFTNNHNVENFIKISFGGSLTITDGENTLVSISGAPLNSTYYSEYGICLDTSANFVSGNPIKKISIPANSTLVLTIIGADSIDHTSREII